MSARFNKFPGQFRLRLRASHLFGVPLHVRLGAKIDTGIVDGVAIFAMTPARDGVEFAAEERTSVHAIILYSNAKQVN